MGPRDSMPAASGAWIARVALRAHASPRSLSCGISGTGAPWRRRLPKHPGARHAVMNHERVPADFSEHEADAGADAAATELVLFAVHDAE